MADAAFTCDRCGTPADAFGFACDCRMRETIREPRAPGEPVPDPRIELARAIIDIGWCHGDKLVDCRWCKARREALAALEELEKELQEANNG